MAKPKRIWLAYLIAFALDAVDFLVLGVIPIVGDAVDLMGIVLLYPFIRAYAVIPIVEFMPIIGDFLPSFLFAVWLSQSKLLGRK